MRKSESPSFGKTATRLFVAALLASVATGCSSDVSRFGGVFSTSDNITTNSVPRRTLFGSNPVPRGEVAGAGQVVPVTADESRDTALNQPFPGQDDISRDPINTSTNTGSGTRLASTPVIVEREALVDPSRDREREEALSQPLPGARQTTTEQAVLSNDTATGSDGIVTGTVQTRQAGWSAANGPVVMLRQGETVQTLSNRFGVPEKEILKANGLKRSADAQPGQKIVIPTFSAGGAARASVDSSIDTNGKIPVPDRKTNHEVAILPSSAAGRDKAAEDAAGKVAGKDKAKIGSGGAYEVKPGDTLTKIANKTGVSVDALKQANGLSTASIRIGQKLKLPGAGGEMPDNTVTASVPDAKKTQAKAEAEIGQKRKSVETASITTAEAGSDVTEAAPESTGIGKYRWPVRGAVVAGYGANVDGNRNDGIDISVPEGTPIKAAENGVVIYSGSSLKELGNAVLVRHDDGTVTVYGHAGDLNVQRGQKVQRGQTLASSGMSGNTSRPKVHFEVRKNATPVDPLTFLE